jgi:hypothetical protein
LKRFKLFFKDTFESVIVTDLTATNDRSLTNKIDFSKNRIIEVEQTNRIKIKT